MNRIYQGRICECKLHKDGTNRKNTEYLPFDEEIVRAKEIWENRLWQHHQLFQDAVNYYIVSLVALAHSPSSKLAKLKDRLAAVWQDASKKGQTREGLGASIQRSLGNEIKSIEDVIERIRKPLTEDKIPSEAYTLAAEFLLHKLGGEGAIQQGSKTFLPMFCYSDFSGTFQLGSSGLGQKIRQDFLQNWLYKDHTDEEIIDEANRTSLADVVKINHQRSGIEGNEAKLKLKEAVLHFQEKIDLAKYSLMIERLENILIPRNRRYNSADRFYSCLLFKYLPSQETKQLFQNSFPAPKAPTAKKKVSKKDSVTDKDFIFNNSDPIERSRGSRGYVFPSFSSLAIWEGAKHGIAIWKEFDIAAFAEALKVINQFEQNVTARDNKIEELKNLMAYMDGDFDAKLPRTDESQEVKIPVFKKELVSDCRIEQLKDLVNNQLSEEYRLVEGKSMTYGLRRRTLKGWNKIQKAWRKVIKPDTEYSDEMRNKLIQIINDYQTKNTENIGSTVLFRALLDKQNWIIWREPVVEEQKVIEDNGFAEDPINAFREYCETRETLEDIQARPLNFTPANARYSRRLYMFSDIGNSCKLDIKDFSAIAPIAYCNDQQKWLKRVIRFSFTSPRFHRDDLDKGVSNSRWLQPMMKALEMNDSDTAIAFRKQNKKKEWVEKEPAVQLMPDWDKDGKLRFLLNLSVDLNETSLKESLRKGIWEKQFKSWNRGEQLPFLKWSEEFDDQSLTKAWFKKLDVFTCLSSDLGQRDCAAIAILRGEKANNKPTNKSRFIGEVDSNQWYGTITATKLLHLPGEDAEVFREGKLHQEFYGEKGRSATSVELAETECVITELLDKDSITLLGFEPSSLSFPELNDRLLLVCRRAQSRLHNLIRWHWMVSNPDNEEQREKVLNKILEQKYYPEIAALAKLKQFSQLEQSLRKEIQKLRKKISQSLLVICNRILPLRGRKWEWITHPEKANCHLLQQSAPGTSNHRVKICGQRGLSIERIEQINELRRRFHSLNQSLRRELGKKPLSFDEMRNVSIPDPCPDILRKMENLRKQRVNQTAHLITAQALGVRLKPHSIDRKIRKEKDIHGEYEKFREPVDFVILENLSRYLSDQGRSRRENSRLMKWCHRAIVAKIKQLLEPFGIQVLQTPAAYSSKFCSRSGIAGFRAMELTSAHKNQFPWCKWADESNKDEKLRNHVRKLFSDLEKLNKNLPVHKHRKLIAPMNGGPLFVSIKDGINTPAIQQADINAAASLAFRAIAHPSVSDIHVRIRSEKGKTKENRRWSQPVTIQGVSDQVLPSGNPNFFADIAKIADFDQVSIEGVSIPVASSRGLWKAVRDKEWSRCGEINRKRILKIDKDDIPM